MKHNSMGTSVFASSIAVAAVAAFIAAHPKQLNYYAEPQAYVSQAALHTVVQGFGQAFTAELAAFAAPDPAQFPVLVQIPSIKLAAPIENMGVNTKGEMDAPDGTGRAVGWYKDGAVPGALGSAVFDAHVFAAFSKLRFVKPGQDIFVTTAAGKKLHFIVTDSRVYKLGELPPSLLFAQNDARRLNLITCAGKPTKDGSTYDHRLVVYTKLVEES